MNPLEPRHDLNNACQHLFRDNASRMPQYEYKSRGPPNNTIWTAIIYIEGIEYGKGEGKTKGAAADAAATQALVQLRDQYDDE